MLVSFKFICSLIPRWSLSRAASWSVGTASMRRERKASIWKRKIGTSSPMKQWRQRGSPRVELRKWGRPRMDGGSGQFGSRWSSSHTRWKKRRHSIYEFREDKLEFLLLLRCYTSKDPRSRRFLFHSRRWGKEAQSTRRSPRHHLLRGSPVFSLRNHKSFMDFAKVARMECLAHNQLHLLLRPCRSSTWISVSTQQLKESLAHLRITPLLQISIKLNYKWSFTISNKIKLKPIFI